MNLREMRSDPFKATIPGMVVYNTNTVRTPLIRKHSLKTTHQEFACFVVYNDNSHIHTAIVAYATVRTSDLDGGQQCGLIDNNRSRGIEHNQNE